MLPPAPAQRNKPPPEPAKSFTDGVTRARRPFPSQSPHILGRQSGDQRLDGPRQHRVHPARRDLGQRHQDKGPLVGARMRQHRIGRAAHRVAHRHDVQVHLNPGWSADQVAAGLDLLDRQREKLLDALLPPDRGLLIALGGVGSDSATQSAALGDQRSLPQPGHPQQFYLCTDAADYQALAASPYNVVLLQHVRARDDGSLARRAAVRGVRYLRIETSPGDAAQRDMLAWAEAHLP